MLCPTKYYQKDVVVADIIATDAPYFADPTGKTDSTAAIQAALNACRALGGGVVFLPAGLYLVTETVNVPAGCILQGDWQDPNEVDDPEYGTVIVAKPTPLSPDQIDDRAARPLLTMEGLCGMIGLTFYYPEQSIEQIVPYGYTIYGEAPRIAALRGDWKEALARIDDALALGQDEAKLWTMKGIFLRKMTSDFGQQTSEIEVRSRKSEVKPLDCFERAIQCDPLEYWAVVERDGFSAAEKNRGLKAQQLLECIPYIATIVAMAVYNAIAKRRARGLKR